MTKPSNSHVRIVACDCKHEHQDAQYGKGKRSANRCKQGAAHRCTVCAKVHNA